MQKTIDYLAELADNRPAQPDVVCGDCGRRYGWGPFNDFATWYEGNCGVCHQEKIVTEPRDFGLLRPQWENHNV